MPTIPVSYPNKKPAVQIKYPKRYARKAPSLVPVNPMLYDVAHTDHEDTEEGDNGNLEEILRRISRLLVSNYARVDYHIHIPARMQHATYSVGYAIARLPQDRSPKVQVPSAKCQQAKRTPHK